MNKIIYKISGMHCKACEILIEDKLKEINLNWKIVVNNKKETAEIFYDNEVPNEELIRTELKKMGYDIEVQDQKFITKNKNIFSREKKSYKELLIAGAMFVILYMLFGLLKLDKIFTVDMSSNSVSLSTAILIGLAAGVSTCMALVGGLIVGVSAKFASKYPNLNTKQKFIPHLFFNFGRIFGFFIFGGIIGAVGSVFKISTSLVGLLTIFVGIYMFILGLQLLNIFPFISKFKITLPKSISRFFGITDEKKYSNKRTILLGALTFFLPCGFTQAMQLYAISSGSFITGGLIMALFAIGTTPGLLGIGWLTSFIKGRFSGVFFKFIGFAVILFSIFNFNNGYNLTLVKNNNLNNSYNSKNISSCSLEKDGANVCSLDNIDINNIQIIKANFNVKDDISPTVFRVNVNKPVRFEINASEDGSGCMSSIMIPGMYNEYKFIKKGLNVLNFTPTKVGSYPITCAMGVKRGALIVQ
ncbi:MAG: sulfite exporter TauE/SafE family protein [Patescibacteria group bacterium]